MLTEKKNLQSNIDLKEALYSAWERLSLDFAANLIKSMPNKFLMSFDLKINLVVIELQIY